MHSYCTLIVISYKLQVFSQDQLRRNVLTSRPSQVSQITEGEISIDMDPPNTSDQVNLLTSGERIRFSNVLTHEQSGQRINSNEHHSQFEKAKLQLFVALCRV